MLIPYQELSPQSLTALLESYALREGTEYGEQEISLDKKVEQLLAQLKAEEIVIVFDTITQSCDLMSHDDYRQSQIDANEN